MDTIFFSTLKQKNTTLKNFKLKLYSGEFKYKPIDERRKFNKR